MSDSGEELVEKWGFDALKAVLGVRSIARYRRTALELAVIHDRVGLHGVRGLTEFDFQPLKDCGLLTAAHHRTLIPSDLTWTHDYVQIIARSIRSRSTSRARAAIRQVLSGTVATSRHAAAALDGVVAALKESDIRQGERLFRVYSASGRVLNAARTDQATGFLHDAYGRKEVRERIVGIATRDVDLDVLEDLVLNQAIVDRAVPPA